MALTPKIGAANKAAASMPPLRKLAAAVQRSSTRSLLVFGKPKTGKTELINALVSAGLEVHYIDIDGNLLSLSDATISAPNFHYYPVRNGGSHNVWRAFKQLRTEDRIVACHEHGLVGCKACAQSGAPFYELDLMALPPKAIVVTDSFSSYYNSVTTAVVDTNGTDNLQISETDLSFFRTLSSAVVPVWNLLTRLPGAADSLILTHTVDRQNMMNAKNTSSYLFPRSGSGAHSVDVTSLSPVSAVWATQDEPVAAKRRILTKANTKMYAFTPEQFGSFDELAPAEAIVEFFKRGR